MAQVVELLPSKSKALTSNPCNTHTHTHTERERDREREREREREKERASHTLNIS
jgi:hypothetical protein